jgi:hypothetical protein
MRHCHRGHAVPRSDHASHLVSLNRVRRRERGCARVAYSIRERKEDKSGNVMTGDWETVNVIATRRALTPSDACVRVKGEVGYPVGCHTFFKRSDNQPMCTQFIGAAMRTYLHNCVVYAEISIRRAQIAIYFYKRKQRDRRMRPKSKGVPRT